MTAETADRLVIREYRFYRSVLTRARILTTANIASVDASDLDGELTAVGRALLDRLNMIDGLQVGSVLRYGVLIKLYDEVLWDWADVERNVVAAFDEATGLAHQVLRLGGGGNLAEMPAEVRQGEAGTDA